MSKQNDDAFEQLISNLTNAHATFTQHTDTQREGLEQATIAVVDYLSASLPAEHVDKLSLPFIRLLAALRNPHSGLLQDVIRQAGKKTGGSSLGADEDAFRAFAAMAAEILTQHAMMPAAQANLYVARKLTSAGWFKKRRSQGNSAQIDASTIEGWRQSYRSGSKQIPGMLNAVVSNRISQLTIHDAHKFADLIITDLLPDYYGHMRTDPNKDDE